MEHTGKSTGRRQYSTGVLSDQFLLIIALFQFLVAGCYFKVREPIDMSEEELIAEGERLDELITSLPINTSIAHQLVCFQARSGSSLRLAR